DNGLLGGRSGLSGRGSRNGARFVRRQLGLQLLVLGDGLAPLDDDLIEEVIDLVRVEALLEPDMLELLGDDVFGGESHCVVLFQSFTTEPLGGDPRTASRIRTA